MGFQKYYATNLKETKEKIKAGVDKDDFILQSINHISELNKITNLLSKRLREWYGLYNPEFSRQIEDHEKFVELIVSGDDPKIKDSMGGDLSKEDIKPFMDLAKKIKEMYEFKQMQTEYLEKVMKEYCPNISAVAGESIGAKLLALAGSLKRLAFFPASTVQLLGAEKSLFRHLRTGARPPRHGVIVQHPLVASASQKDHGKRARALADKISLAAKIDYFKGEFIGEKLRTDLEKRFK